MSLGQRVEVSLTGIRFREGLWHCYYPGTIVGIRQIEGMYKVALDDFDRIWLDSWRVYPEREKVLVEPQLGLRVDVQLPDTSRQGDQPVWIWWSGRLKKKGPFWKVEWDFGKGDDPSHNEPMYVGDMRPHKPLGWNPLIIARPCRICKALKPQLFNNGLLCAQCVGYRLKSKNSRQYIAQKWILQLGGLSKACDVRLIRQWAKAKGSRK